jgi:hypothetical protein
VQEDLVVWKNTDTQPHSATANNGAFDTGLIQPGGAAVIPIRQPVGTISYGDVLNPSLTGRIAVMQ